MIRNENKKWPSKLLHNWACTKLHCRVQSLGYCISCKKEVIIGETIHNNTAYLNPKPNLVPLRNGKAQNVWQYLPQLTLYFETELLLLTISLLVTVPHSQGSFWILIYMTVTDQLLIKEHLTCHPDSKQPDISALLSTWHLLRLQHLQHLPSNMK